MRSNDNVRAMWRGLRARVQLGVGRRLLGGMLAAAALVAPGAALASTGCDAVNAGVLNFTTTFTAGSNAVSSNAIAGTNAFFSASGLRSPTYTPLPTNARWHPTRVNFANGEVLTYTITRIGITGTVEATFGYSNNPSTAFTNTLYTSSTTQTHAVSAATEALQTYVGRDGTPDGGTISFAVTCSGGAPAAPTVVSLNPAFGAAAGGTSVMLTGTNFTGATAVAFGASPATFTFNSATSITATAPVGAAGATNVRVTTPGGTSATGAGNQFTYIAPPAAPTVNTPANGSRTNDNTPTYSGTSGASLTIALTVNGTSFGSTTSDAGGNWTLTPATPLADGTYAVRATASNNGVGSPNSNTNTFTVDTTPPAAPVVTTPVTGTTTGDTTPTLTGTAEAGSTVTILRAGSVVGTTSADGAGNWSFTSSQLATGSAYSFTAIATDSVGNASPASAPVVVTVAEAPTVTAISPASGPTGGGTAVAITGSNFTGVTAVTFGATPAASFTFNSATSITATSPGGSAGAVDIRVTTGGGTSAISVGDQFTYVAAPTANGFTYSSAVPFNTGAGPATTFSVSLFVFGGPTSFAVDSAATDQGGTVSINNAGTVSYTPAPGFHGIDTFRYTASNAGGTSAAATVRMGVAAPIFSVALPSGFGAAGTAYNSAAAPVVISGGWGPYVINSSSGTPTGMLFNPATGILSGTPTVAGLYTLSFSISDSSFGTIGNHTANVSASLTVAAPIITVDPSALANARIGVAYSQAITAAGGTADYGYAVTAGALPAGLTLSVTGALSGTPTASGAFNFTITATDALGYTGARPYTLTVNSPILTLSPTMLPLAGMGAPYSQTVVASGGTGPYSYAVTGALVPGLNLSPTGVLSGTPTGWGIYNFTITATDSSTGAGAPFSVSDAYSVMVNTFAAIGATIDFSPSSLEAGAVGTTTITLTNPNGSSTAPFPAHVRSDDRVVDRVAGAAGGTCSVGSTITTATTVTHLNDIVVPPGSCTITLAYRGRAAGLGTGFALSPFLPGNGYPMTMPTEGSDFVVVPTVTSISPNSGPAGQVVTISGAGFNTTPSDNTVTFGGAGVGTVTAASATSLTVTAPVAGPGPVNVSVTVNGQVSMGAATFTFIAPPTVTDRSGVVVPYNSTGTAIDLGASITGLHTSIAIGSAPTHGTTSVAGDVVTYTPATGYHGADSFTYTATGPGGTSTVATVSLTVATPAAPVVADLNGVAVPYNSAGTTIDLATSITGVHSAIAISSAPAHGTVSIAGDVATYTPTASYHGADDFTWTATGPGGTAAPATVAIVVGGPTVVVTPSSGDLGRGRPGLTFIQSLGASGGTGPYSFAHTGGTMPPGMAVVGSAITGTPTAAGTFTFDVTATDSSTGAGASSSAPATYTLTIDPLVLVLDPASAPAATTTQPYSLSITSTGGHGAITYSLTGSLPPGLSLSTTGLLSGTPIAGGNYPFTVTGTDSLGFTGSQAYTLVVVDPVITITSPSPGALPGGLGGTAYAPITFAGGGGRGPLTFSIAAGALPAGMAFSTSGVLSGTPTMSGTFNFQIAATDASPAPGPFVSIPVAFSLTVDAPAITVGPAALPAGTSAMAYSETLTASGGTAPYSYAVTAGALPTGVTLDGGGVLSGVAGASGAFNFTVTTTDTYGFTGSRAYTVAVADPVLTLTAPAAGALPVGQGGVVYSQSFTATGGQGAHSFILAGGTLPAGLSLSSGGVLSGTPTTAGSFSFAIRATDASPAPGPFSSPAVNYTLEIVIAVPVVTPKTASVMGGQSVTIDVAADAVGFDLTSVAVASAPSHGAAVVSGMTIVYTADGAYSGPDSFTYTVSNAGGASLPGTVSITVNPAVVAGPPKTLTILAGQTAVVELTEGATGEPFTGAAVVSVSPAGAGTATIAARTGPSGQLYDLTFKPDDSFTGEATVLYTLSNAFATSAPGTVTITVEARPDPAQDPEVSGLISAQTETARRFATAQISNINRRLERLHGGGAGESGFSSSLTLGFGSAMASSTASDPSELRKMQDSYGVIGGLTGTRLGFDGGAPSSRTEDLRTAGPGGTGPNGSGSGPWGAWVSGAANFGTVDDGRDREGFKFSTDGLTIGADRRFGDALVVGGAVGWAYDSSRIGDNGTRSEADAWSVALYGSWQPAEKAFFDVVLGYGRLDFDSRRYVTANGDFAYGKREGDQWFGAATAGWDYHHARGLNLSPYGRIEATRSVLDAFTEEGGGVFALAYDEQATTTVIGALGVKGDYAFKTRLGRTIPSFRIEYAYDLKGTGTARLRYADWLDGEVYALKASPLDKNRMLYGLGLDLVRGSGMRLGLDYEGMLSGDQTSSTVRFMLETPF